MKLTTRGRYALYAMLDLSLHDQEIPVNLAEIAQRHKISRSYLEQLFSKLRRSGLVKSVRGPKGGYLLGKDPSHITLAQIIYTVRETVDMTECGGQQNCQGTARCLLHDLWMEFNQHMSEFLNGITLGELSKRKNIRATYQRLLS